MTQSLDRWLDRLERRHPRSIDLGLERCGDVYRRMGSPRPGQRVVTVAGTNGKGSTVAWLEATLAALGHRVAAYTSPHLRKFNERLRLSGRPVTDRDLVTAFEHVESARGAVSLTYFEFTTLACLELMAQAGSEYALLEVGLGGRLDTVNLVDADLAVLTPIGLDHQDFLGPDRESIGREKAGIFRPHQTVVIGDPDPPASVTDHARELACRVLLAERDFHHSASNGEIAYRFGALDWRLTALPLAGEHQAGNLAAALTAAAMLEPGLASSRNAVVRSLASVRLPGRLQSVAVDPRLCLDVGHNPHAAHAVARRLALADQGPCCVVLGMLADKDVAGVAQALGPVVEHWYCAPLSGPRGQTGERLAQRLREALPEARTQAAESVAEALALARRYAGETQTILVFGSFETVAAALTALEPAQPATIDAKEAAT